MKLRTLGLTLVVLMVLLLAGCGGGEPTSMDDIGVYPQAEVLAEGQDTMADEMRNLMQEALEESTEEGVGVESDLYLLPGGGDWEDVKDFYSGELDGSDWQVEEEFTEESEQFRSIGWSRGSGAGEQAFVVAYIPSFTGDDAYLMTFLVSE
ncbi:MAG: hypothetical protein ACLFU8_07030 [Anaerolineales bacterium]